MLIPVYSRYEGKVKLSIKENKCQLQCLCLCMTLMLLWVVLKVNLIPKQSVCFSSYITEDFYFKFSNAVICFSFCCNKSENVVNTQTVIIRLAIIAKPLVSQQCIFK